MTDYEHSSNYHKMVDKIHETNNLKDVEILKTKLRSLEQDDEVRELIEKCDERIEEIQNLIKEEKYQKAISENTNPEADLDSLIKQFQEIEGYKDSSSILKSLRNEKEYRFLVKAFDSGDDWDWERICSGFEDLGDYKESKKYFKASIPKRDQQRKEKELREKKEHEAKLESEYNEALSVMRQGYLMAASEKFRNLGDYKDAKEKAEECKKKQNEIEEGKNREKRITLLVIIGAVFLMFAVYLVICLTRWKANDFGHWHVIAGSTVGYSEHEYALTQEVLPTCVEDGYRDYVCDTCGWHLIEQLKATGHTLDGGKVSKEPTCTEPGRMVYTCKTCGFVLKTEEVPAKGHSLDEGEVTNAPTCTETGTKVYTCKTCGSVVKTEMIPANGHTPDGGKVTKEPTCTETGTMTYICTTCGTILKPEVIPAKGHTSDGGKVTKEPTCTETGTRIYTCKTCGIVVKAEVIPAKGHDFDDTNVCRRCGSIVPFYKVGDIGPAGGYVFYDKGNYSDGWRYLEAAPADFSYIKNTPSIDTSNSLYGYGDQTFLFGLYKYSAKNCTGTAIGTGKKNTELLVKAMDSNLNKEKTDVYAAKVCSDLVYNGFDDWFLPSKDELDLMYNNLYKAGLGGFASYYYWSSSECDGDAYNAWFQYFFSGYQYGKYRNEECRVRAVRLF